MNDGINEAIAARVKSRKYWEAKYPAPAKTSRKTQKPTTRRFGSRLGKQETE